MSVAPVKPSGNHVYFTNRRVQRMTERSNHPMYLLDAVTNAVGDYVFHISGTTQNIYLVTVSKSVNNAVCSCPDFTTYCDNLGCYCKHIYFVLFRVLKVLSYKNHIGRNNFEYDSDTMDFINNRKLSDTQMTAISTSFQSLDQTRDDISKSDLRSVFERIKKEGKSANKLKSEDDSTLDKYTEISKEIEEDDDCPICFDSLDIEGNEELMSCPHCKNVLHKQCMEEWIQRGKTHCVYCEGQWTELSTVVSKHVSGSDRVFRNLDQLTDEQIVIQSNQPKENTQSVPVVEEETPVPVVEEETPVSVVEEETPVPVVEEETPVPVVEEETPVSVVEEETPVSVVEEETPVPVVEEETPVPVQTGLKSYLQNLINRIIE